MQFGFVYGDVIIQPGQVLIVAAGMCKLAAEFFQQRYALVFTLGKWQSWVASSKFGL